MAGERETLTSEERRALGVVGMWEDVNGRWRSDLGPLTPAKAKAHAVELAQSVLRALAPPPSPPQTDASRCVACDGEGGTFQGDLWVYCRACRGAPQTDERAAPCDHRMCACPDGCECKDTECRASRASGRGTK